MDTALWLDFLLGSALAACLLLAYSLWSRGRTDRLPSPGSAIETQPVDQAAQTAVMSESPYATLPARVARQAGFEPQRIRWLVWGARICLALILPLVVLNVWLKAPAPMLLLAAVLGFFAPDLYLLATRRARRRRVVSGLSYFLDLMVALLRSGLSVEEAFMRAGRDGFKPSHPLAQEVALVSRELDIGRDRDAAFQALADRTGVPELKIVAAAIRIGLRHGVAMEETLSAQAELMRVRRREQALKQINAAAIKALVPVLLCGMPIFLVLVFFPAVVELMDTIKRVAALVR